MLNSMIYSLPEALEDALQVESFRWKQENVVSRIWAKDASVWTNSGEENWLNWLDVVETEGADLGKYADLTEYAKNFETVCLLGMGGSSLCPEVLAITLGVKNFYILDSTVPAQIISLESKLDLVKTLFIVASKSGSTLEPNCFKQYFFERVCDAVGRENAGKHFVAITDPSSKMQKVAEADGFAKILFGDPKIGGRFSALSPFGLAAGATMNLNLQDFLSRTSEMVTACKSDSPTENPGALLGLILGLAHRHGLDKLTIFTSPEIYDLGAWLEQLVAESTGKNGVAIIPIDREPLLSSDLEDDEGNPIDFYSQDRVFVCLKTKDSALDKESEAAMQDIADCGHPFIVIELGSIYDLGQEFFRWEFATAVAGAVMGINPFDQPDVESAKIEARKITEEYEQSGKLPDESPFFEADGIKLFTSEKYAKELLDAAEEEALSDILEAHLLNLDENDYFALLAYIEMNAENELAVQKIREAVLDVYQCPTCLGFGPRFLHSTGQAYKGGANNGVFLQITSDDAQDLQVPQQKYTFGVVKAAQSRGDFQVLKDRDRRALRVHLGADVKAGLEKIKSILTF